MSTDRSSDPAPAAPPGDGPNFALIDAIFRHLRCVWEELVDEGELNRVTARKFFDRKRAKHTSLPSTYDEIAGVLQKRLNRAGLGVELQGRALRQSFPRERLPDPLQQLLGTSAPEVPPPVRVSAAVAAHGGDRALPALGICAVYDTQKRACDAFFRQLTRLGPQVEGKRATVLVNSPHLIRYLIEELFRDHKIGQVTLCVGSPVVALAVKSRRQAYLIDANLGSEYRTDYDHLLRDGRLKLVRYNVPPPFPGYHIEGVAVCMGYYGWFPTFRGHQKDERVIQLRADFEQAGLPLPSLDDPFTLNGHLMPHVQVFKGPNDGPDSDYGRLALKFELEARALELFHDLNPTHKDFVPRNIPNPDAAAPTSRASSSRGSKRAKRAGRRTAPTQAGS